MKNKPGGADGVSLHYPSCPLQKSRRDERLVRLGENQLTELLQAVNQECARRARLAAKGLDPLADILDSEAAKRALLVAAAGTHTILFVGPSASGKTMLRAAGLALGVEHSFEARFCPCGNWPDPHTDCRCTASQMDRYRRRWPLTDISVETFRLGKKYAGNASDCTLADLQQALQAMRPVTCSELDESSGSLFRAAVREQGIDPAQQETILAVARSIAGLDRARQIGPAHIVEAINYRPLRPRVSR